jgi:rhamnosyl/mannosyltransferase
MGGIETHLHALCGELQKSMDVEVIVANEGLNDVSGIIDGTKVTRLGTLFNLAGAPICRGMVRSIREARADIIHLHHPHPSAALAYFASGHQGRLVVTYHADVVRQRILGRVFQPFLNRLLSRSEAIIAASPDIVEHSPTLRAQRDRCHVIPYGIPLDSFQHCDIGAVQRIRERYGSPLVVSVGRLVYYKGFEYLIEAVAGTKASLLIIGEGPLRGKLEKKALACGVADRVAFLGRIENLVPYYYAADAFALASVTRSEAFGIVQVEAMACATPVVNTQLESGVPFVSLDGETGITVPPADGAALAAAINLLVNDPTLRQAYGNAARERARREFSVEVMAKRTLKLYAEVLDSVQDPYRERTGPNYRLDCLEV